MRQIVRDINRGNLVTSSDTDTRDINNVKGLVLEHLIAIRGCGFIQSWTKTNASSLCVEERQDDYIKGIYFPGIYSLNLVRLQLAALSLAGSFP